jgi:hypothetical protein
MNVPSLGIIKELELFVVDYLSTFNTLTNAKYRI